MNPSRATPIDLIAHNFPRTAGYNPGQLARCVVGTLADVYPTTHRYLPTMNGAYATPLPLPFGDARRGGQATPRRMATTCARWYEAKYLVALGRGGAFAHVERLLPSV